MLTLTQTQPHPDVMIREASVSDLFFSYDHPAYDKLYAHKDANPSDLEVSQALYSDAADFSATIDRATGLKVDPLQLVDDFLRRL